MCVYIEKIPILINPIDIIQLSRIKKPQFHFIPTFDHKSKKYTYYFLRIEISTKLRKCRIYQWWLMINDDVNADKWQNSFTRRKKNIPTGKYSNRTFWPSKFTRTWLNIAFRLNLWMPTLSHKVFTWVSVSCLHSFSCSIHWSKSLSVALSSIILIRFLIHN